MTLFQNFSIFILCVLLQLYVTSAYGTGCRVTFKQPFPSVITTFQDVTLKVNLTDCTGTTPTYNMLFLNADIELDLAILSSSFSSTGEFTFNTPLNLLNNNKYGPLHTIVVKASLSGETVDSLKFQARWLPPFHSYIMGTAPYASMTGTVTAAGGCSVSTTTITCATFENTQTITPAIGSPVNMETGSQIYYYIYTSNYERPSLRPCIIGECLDDNQCDVAPMTCNTQTNTCVFKAWPTQTYSCLRYTWPDASQLYRCNIDNKCYWQQTPSGSEDCTEPQNCILRCAVETCPSTNQYVFALSQNQVTPHANAYKATGFRYWQQITGNSGTDNHKNMMFGSVMYDTRDLGLLIHIYARDTSDSRWKHVVSNTAYLIDGTDGSFTEKDDRTLMFRCPSSFNVADGERAFVQYLFIEYQTTSTNIVVQDGAGTDLGDNFLVDGSAKTGVIIKASNQIATATAAVMAAHSGCDNIVIAPFDFYHMSWSDIFPSVYDLQLPDETACASSVGAGYANLAAVVRPTWLVDVHAVQSTVEGKLVINPVQLAKYFQPGTLYSDIYIYHRYSTTSGGEVTGTVGRQFSIQIPAFDLSAGHPNVIEAVLNVSGEQIELGFCGCTPWDYSSNRTGYETYQVSYVTTYANVLTDLDEVPPKLKGSSFPGSTTADQVINFKVYDKDTYQGIPSSMFRSTSVVFDWTNDGGTYAPVGYAIKNSCKTPISVYTGFDMWLEFIDRPLDQHFSIYNSMTYTVPTYTASMYEQSRRNPSLFRIFGEHMRTSAITTFKYTAVGASTFTVSKAFNLNNAVYITTPPIATNKVLSPTTTTGYTATVNVKCTKKNSPITQNVICEGVCVKSSVQYVFFQTTKTLIDVTFPSNCDSYRLRYCVQAGTCVDEAISITVNAPTFNTAALTNFLAQKTSYAIFAASYTQLVAGVSTESDIIPFATSYLKNLQYTLAVPIYYDNNGVNVRYINPIAIRHLMKILDTMYTNLVGTWANAAKTTSLWIPLMHEFGLLMSYVINAIEYLELPSALLAEYKDVFYKVVLDCWVLKIGLTALDQTNNTSLISFVTRWVEQFKNGYYVDKFNAASSTLTGIFGKYLSYLFNSYTAASISVSLSKCSMTVPTKVVDKMLAGNNFDNIYTIIERRVVTSGSSQTLAANGNITPLTTLGIEIYFRNRNGEDIPIPTGETITLTLTTDTDGVIGHFSDTWSFWYDRAIQSEAALSGTTKTFYVTQTGLYAILASGSVFKKPYAEVVAATTYVNALADFTTQTSSYTSAEQAEQLNSIITNLKAAEITGKTEAVTVDGVTRNRISDPTKLSALTTEVKQIQAIVTSGNYTVADSNFQTAVNQLVGELIPRIVDSVISPADAITQEILTSSIQQALEVNRAIRDSAAITEDQKTTINGYITTLQSAFMKNFQQGSTITSTNGMYKSEMHRVNSTTNPSGLSVQNDQSRSKPTVEIPVGELTESFTYFINFQTPTATTSNSAFRQVVSDQSVTIRKFDSNQNEKSPANLSTANSYTLKFTVSGYSSCGKVNLAFMDISKGDWDLSGISFVSETVNSDGTLECSYKSDHLTEFAIVVGDQESFKEEVTNGIFLCGVCFALLLGLVMDTQSPPKAMRDYTMIGKLDRKLEITNRCGRCFFAFYYLNSVVSVFTAKDRFIWATTRVMTLMVRLAFIFALTGFLFSSTVVNTLDLDQGVGSDLYLRSFFIGIVVVTLVGLLRMFGIFAINFCIRKTKCKSGLCSVNKEKVESVRGDISINFDQSRTEIGNSELDNSRTSAFVEERRESKTRNKLYGRRNMKNDKKAEVIQESVAARKPIRHSPSNNSVSELNQGEESPKRNNGVNLENMANLGLYQFLILFIEILIVCGSVFISLFSLNNAFESDQAFWLWLFTSGASFTFGSFILEPIMFGISIMNEGVDQELRPYKRKCCSMIAFGFKNALLLRERKLLGGNRFEKATSVVPFRAPYRAEPVGEEDDEESDQNN